MITTAAPSTPAGTGQPTPDHAPTGGVGALSASSLASSQSFAEAKRRSDQLEAELVANAGSLRVLTGDRPTGPLHLGHYFGTLKNRVRLQQAGADLFVVIADYQVITDRERTGDIRGNVRELLLDYLSVGIDPQRATIFTHSAVPALNQLVLPFLSLVSVAELQRNPTVKAEARAAGIGSLGGLLLTYPVHQAADILFCGGNVVPVGRDQLPHIELSRTIARRFNERYGPTFTEPAALLSDAPLLLGTNGVKMSKSAGNAVYLRSTADDTALLIRGARTDGERRITYEPRRRPEVASLLLTAALCAGTSPEVVAEEIGNQGSGRLKELVIELINEHFRETRIRRIELSDDERALRRVLTEGNERANVIADRMLANVQAAMGMSYL